jgi:predicted dehydrogenase
MRRPLTVGLIGLGYWGPNLLRVLADDPEVAVRWLCDRDAERLERFARRHPWAQATTRLEQVLDDPETDAVVIATPLSTHFELAAASLAAGKHTFVEKPLAASAALAGELLARAGRAGRLLMCGHTFLYSPPVRAARLMLDAGALGDVYFASSSRVNLGPYRSDVSVVWDLGPHDFSILLYWFGAPPATLRATGRAALASGIADVAFVTMTFPGGVVANVELSWLAPSKLRRTVIVGSEKMLVYEDGSTEPIRLFDRGIQLGAFGRPAPSYRTGDTISPHLDGREPLAAELGEFVRAALEGDPLHAQSALALDVVRMTEAAERSLLLGGVAVAVSDGTVAEPRRFRPQAPDVLVEEPAA